MNKVLVHVYVAKMDREFEMFLPVNKRINDIICMIAKSLSEISNGVFPEDYQNALFDLEQNIFLDPQVSLKEAKINNGKKLLFF